MNEQRERMKREEAAKERECAAAVAADAHRLRFHLMPKIGWLNDPNGLCQFHGIYHIFYQYAPMDARGALKMWAHMTTRDFIHWEQQPTELYPDMPFDKDGVYSGSALIDHDKMYLFYTGNAKQDGDHDYITSGREANTVLVGSTDGFHFSEKELLMTNADYPAHYTCHIRDPKVFCADGRYYMVQGGRMTTDQGAVLLFTSDNLRDWTCSLEVTTQDAFGYMWECPDYFELESAHILSFSPQGVLAEKYRYQNTHQSGYLMMDSKLTADNMGDKGQLCRKIVSEAGFREWDYGFDFYAPQTFLDETGRRILIGWAGAVDADYDNEPTIEKGWQHALTLPRELVLADGVVCQRPIRELSGLRGHCIDLQEENVISLEQETCEAELYFEEKEMPVQTSMLLTCQQESIEITWSDGIMRVDISDGAGRGRGSREICIKELKKLRLFLDTSMFELYINDGEDVFTSRFYFPSDERHLSVSGMTHGQLWYLKQMQGI